MIVSFSLIWLVIIILASLLSIILLTSLFNGLAPKLISYPSSINFGARPLKREVSRVIETMLAKMIITNEVKDNEVLLIDYKGNNYIINKII